MLKKITTALGTFSLICFSFYYTDNAIDLIRKNDPIMKEIINYSDNYGNTSVASTLINNNIIPGIKGKVVDIDKSYINMKRLGKFDKSLIVFEEVLPINSITDNFNNYIISGNKNKNNVSFIFIIEDYSYIEEILTILNKKNIKASFFVSKEIIDSSLDLIKLILVNNHNIELLDKEYNTSTIKKYNSIINTISSNKISYCYTNIKNNQILNDCSSEKLYTIIPSIETQNYPYNEVKNNLENGSIISFTNNKNTVRELSSIIKYIMQKGKNIVPLKKLLEE